MADMDARLRDLQAGMDSDSTATRRGDGGSDDDEEASD